MFVFFSHFLWNEMKHSVKLPVWVGLVEEEEERR